MKFKRFLREALVLNVFLFSCAAPQPQAELTSRQIGKSLKDKGELLCGNTLPADHAPYRFDLTKCSNLYSYLDVVVQPGGINDVMDADGERLLTIHPAESIKSKKDLFAEKVKRRVLNLFKKDPEQNLDQLISGLHGRKTTSLRMAGIITTALLAGSYELTMVAPQAAVRIAPYVTIASDGGSYIELSGHLHFINVGYATGSNLQKDLRKGRSFGVTKERAALDASDADYLEGLEAVLKAGHAEAYYRAMFRFLTASDTSLFPTLDPHTQSIIVDFAAVYTAELDRHLMVDLAPGVHAWEQDLLEASWASAYVAASGKIFKQGLFADGRPRDFFAQGISGGGIGKTIKDRRLLSAAISQYMWQLEDHKTIKNLATLIGASENEDIFHKLGSLFNTRDKAVFVLENADALTEAATEFMVEVAKEAQNITTYISKNK